MLNQEAENTGNKDQSFLKKYISRNIFWAILILLIVIGLNILINKFAGSYFKDLAGRISGNYLLTGFAFLISEISIGIFPAELFMLIYQMKDWNEFLIILLVLGVISSICGLIAFSAGRYLNAAKIARLVVIQKNFKKYSDLFLKYGWVIIILAATSPLPFALVSFIAGYFKFSITTYAKIIFPVRIIRFLISGLLIKYSISL